MLSKLLKKDLKKDMRWMWVLFVSVIAVAAITRGFKELGNNIMFFKVLGIFFDSVFYSLAVNVILQPFLRNFLNFSNIELDAVSFVLLNFSNKSFCSPDNLVGVITFTVTY